MKTRLMVVGLGGSLCQRSKSLAALQIALEGAAEAEAQTELFDVRSLSLPMYNPEIENPPDSVLRLCEALYAADGLIWSSPMYNGTVSGSFKNALDWLHLLGDRNPPFLTDKVVGLISTAGGVQGLQAVNTMEFIVRALRGWAVPLVMPIAQAWKAFDRNGAPGRWFDRAASCARTRSCQGRVPICPRAADSCGRSQGGSGNYAALRSRGARLAMR
ncbi:MAG: NADPH-dependent FMN reductase [Terriglobia bacterium]